MPCMEYASHLKIIIRFPFHFRNSFVWSFQTEPRNGWAFLARWNFVNSHENHKNEHDHPNRPGTNEAPMRIFELWRQQLWFCVSSIPKQVIVVHYFLCNHPASSSKPMTMTWMAVCAAMATHAIKQCRTIEGFLPSKLILSVNCITKRRKCPPAHSSVESRIGATNFRMHAISLVCCVLQHRYSFPCECSHSIVLHFSWSQYCTDTIELCTHPFYTIYYSIHLLCACDGALIETPLRFVQFFSSFFSYFLYRKNTTAWIGVKNILKY